jgi:hypothetical protein
LLPQLGERVVAERVPQRREGGFVIGAMEGERTMPLRWRIASEAADNRTASWWLPAVQAP